MRTTEAARYARWSVTVAAMLAVMVAGVYVWRAWQVRQAQTTAPPPVPPAVQQRSAEFTFSRVDGNNTRFIVRASRATEFKEGGRTLLEDVWITTFGGNGRRSDQLRTRACEYFAVSGTVTCPDEVLIDLQGNRSTAAASEQDTAADPASGSVHIVTSQLNFNRETGMATSSEAVQFRFSQGEGRAIGLAYDSERGELHLLRDVELVFRADTGIQPAAAELPAVDPMTVSSGALVYRRDDRLIHLSGAAMMRRGRQELQAGQITFELDDDLNARRLVARDHPVFHNPNGNSDVSLSADELAAPLGTAGRLEGVAATGHVVLNALGADGRHQLTATSATLDLIPEVQQPRHFAAAGNVVVLSSLQDGAMRSLQTSQLEVYFVSANEADSRVDRATAAAATMEWGLSSRESTSRETAMMRLKGRLLDGSFDRTGELRELRGSGGVEVQKHSAGDPPVISTSRELLARMAPDGEWSTVEQSGEVRLKNASGDAEGDRALFDRAGDSVTLTGSVVLTDASSQTRAQVATFRQNAGELRAEGSVSTTELIQVGRDAAAETRSEPAHISSARMFAETANGRAVYSGKARLWQGDSVIQADTIELDRANHALIATGNVSAVFPQSRQTQAQGQAAAANPNAKPSPPGFWRAEAGRMVYEEEQHRARLEQGAHARSSDGTIRAGRMDLFFGPASGGASRPAGSGLGASLEGQEVQQAQGFGAVRVESAGRIGTGERADYSAAEGKFVLSGGRPTLIDEFGNSTAGRQLTFLFSDDRIVVDSEEGSRTLTLHRVEK
jgi:lipopolysaccharide export system protein LptA